MQKVLVLGAGLVARPLVRYLLDRGYGVTCASRTVSKAEELLAGHERGEAVPLDLADEGKLAELIAAHDLAISLVPPPLHPVVARHCLDAGKNMVTTSYVSPEMAALDDEARQKNLTVLNEIGVDPGIDHMSAMRIIDDVKRRGGEITAFRSYCGGLPAPQHNNNPFGYKFSWAPRGVLVASRNGAQYLLDGRKVEVQPERLFRDMHVLAVPGAGDFEAYPNRDSISYQEVYGLEGIPTLFRGTLRNMGWCDTIYNFRNQGLMELEEFPVQGRTYAQIMRAHLGCGPEADLQAAFAERAGIPRDGLPPHNLAWLGMFSDRPVPGETTTMLDMMGDLMFEKLAYAPGELDMICLFHDFQAAFPDGHKEHITSQLVEFGLEGGDSAMSRTVSLPAAIAAHMLLQGEITEPGVLRPVLPGIYNPVLDELATLNIACDERTESY